MSKKLIIAGVTVCLGGISLWWGLAYIKLGYQQWVMVDRTINSLRARLSFIPPKWWPLARYVTLDDGNERKIKYAYGVVDEVEQVGKVGAVKATVKLFSGERTSFVLDDKIRFGMFVSDFNTSIMAQFDTVTPTVEEVDWIRGKPIVLGLPFEPKYILVNTLVRLRWDEEVVSQFIYMGAWTSYLESY